MRISLSGIIIAAAMIASGCKTRPESSVRTVQSPADDGNASEADRSLWAVRMGMAVEDAPGGRGALVKVVTPARFAAVIGIETNDVLVALNGKPLSKAGDLQQHATAFVGIGPDAGAWSGHWEFSVVRGQQELTIQAPAGFDCDPYLLVGCGPLTSD